MRRALPIIAVMTALTALPAFARSPSFEERQRIEATLRAGGYTSWGEIELDDEDWVVENARSPQGAQACDIYVDARTLEISEEDCDP